MGKGRREAALEIKKSVMTIYLCQFQIARLNLLPHDPANFSKFFYQPERDSDTSEFINHREDHNHLLKRITTCLREGLIPGINQQYLRDALHDPQTGLTYEALTGKNKQFFPDCERIFFPGVINFLELLGYATDAAVLRSIHNQNKAVDGRGLSEAQRSIYLQDMKKWLLDDWVPWHRWNSNHSPIDVNRYEEAVQKACTPDITPFLL